MFSWVRAMKGGSDGNEGGQRAVLEEKEMMEIYMYRCQMFI